MYALLLLLIIQSLEEKKIKKNRQNHNINKMLNLNWINKNDFINCEIHNNNNKL